MQGSTALGRSKAFYRHRLKNLLHRAQGHSCRTFPLLLLDPATVFCPCAAPVGEKSGSGIIVRNGSSAFPLVGSPNLPRGRMSTLNRLERLQGDREAASPCQRDVGMGSALARRLAWRSFASAFARALFLSRSNSLGLPSPTIRPWSIQII